MKIPIDQIIPDPNQARKTFDEEKLKDLASNIKIQGMIYPIKVRPHNEKYMIVVGELRWRASKLNGDKEIDISDRDIISVNDEKAAEMQFSENHFRQDVPPAQSWRGWDAHMKKYGIKNYHEFNRRTGIPVETVRQGINALVHINMHEKDKLLKEHPTVAKEIARIGTYEKIDRTGKGKTKFIPDTKRQEEVANPFLQGKVASTHAAKISKIAREQPTKPVKEIIEEVVHGIRPTEKTKVESDTAELTGDALILMMDFKGLRAGMKKLSKNINGVPPVAKSALDRMAEETIQDIQTFRTILSFTTKTAALLKGGKK